jgi:hypothetical protein
MMLSAVVAWPFAARARRRRGEPAPEPLARAATAVAFFTAVAWLAAHGLATVSLTGTAQLVHGPPPGLRAALAVGVAAALATFPTFGFAFLALARGFWSLRFRAYYVAVAASALGLVLLWREYNWIGFRY